MPRNTPARGNKQYATATTSALVLTTAPGKRTVAAPFAAYRNRFGGWDVCGTVYLANGMLPSASCVAPALEPRDSYGHAMRKGYRTMSDAQKACAALIGAACPHWSRKPSRANAEKLCNAMHGAV